MGCDVGGGVEEDDVGTRNRAAVYVGPQRGRPDTRNEIGHGIRFGLPKSQQVQDLYEESALLFLTLLKTHTHTKYVHTKHEVRTSKD